MTPGGRSAAQRSGATAGHSLDVAALGNAIIDVIGQGEQALLARLGLRKGSLALVDAARAGDIRQGLGATVEISGGAAANTAAGVAALGGRAAFMGKVRNDALGRTFRADLLAAGVRFDTPPATVGPQTSHCLIVVTPDAQRTMNTYLGASVHLTPADVDADIIGAAAVTYLEGYLWDLPAAKLAFRAAAELARGAGRRVALSLSDPSCVERFRGEFQQLLDGAVDMVFANEAEILALHRTRRFADAVAAARACTGVVSVLTRSEKGAVIVADGEVCTVAAAPAQVVDTTGAGDLYAAGFLLGAVRGRSWERCGHMAGLAAAAVISGYGARAPQRLAAVACRLDSEPAA